MFISGRGLSGIFSLLLPVSFVKLDIIKYKFKNALPESKILEEIDRAALGTSKQVFPIFLAVQRPQGRCTSHPVCCFLQFIQARFTCVLFFSLKLIVLIGPILLELSTSVCGSRLWHMKCILSCKVLFVLSLLSVELLSVLGVISEYNFLFHPNLPIRVMHFGVRRSRYSGF